MRRRGWTVLIGFALVAALTALLAAAPVPYVQMEPGPTYNTLGQDDSGKDVIVIIGAPSTESAGQLRFVTVGVQPRLTLLQAIIGWWRQDDAVVPRELFYPPDKSEEQVQRENQEDFVQSESSAQLAALGELGYTKVSVREVTPGTPADGNLQAGDVIDSINGEKISNINRMLDLIRSGPVGTTLHFQVTRSGATRQFSLQTVADEQGQPRVGFSADVSADAPFTIDIPIEGIGGPSAGLMLSLGIIDKIEPEDLTGGKIIAGTGGVSEFGDVAPMGGIPQKMLGARAAGAQYFLTPADNCAEAMANVPDGLTLVRVESLEQALGELATIRSGGAPTPCS